MLKWFGSRWNIDNFPVFVYLRSTSLGSTCSDRTREIRREAQTGIGWSMHLSVQGIVERKGSRHICAVREFFSKPLRKHITLSLPLLCPTLRRNSWSFAPLIASRLGRRCGKLLKISIKIRHYICSFNAIISYGKMCLWIQSRVSFLGVR